MRALADTHTLFWWLYFPEFLPGKVRDLLVDPDVQVFASAVSAYEMSSKHHRGRWPEVALLVDAFEAIVAAEGFELLPLTARHALRAGAYGRQHRDPFDRMIAAQAVTEGMVLASKDTVMLEMGVDLVWGP